MKTDNASSFRILWRGHLMAMAAMEMSGPFWLIYIRGLPTFADKNIIVWSGLLYIAPVVFAIFSTPLWARLGDKIGHKPMLLRAVAALAISQGLLSVTSDPFWLLSIRALQGACAGLVAVAIAYVVCFPGMQGKTRIISKIHAATAGGSLLGPPLGGGIVSFAGYSGLFRVSALICTIVLIVFWLKLPTQAALLKENQKTKDNQATACRPLPEKYNLKQGGLILGMVMLCITIGQVSRMLSLPYLGVFVESFGVTSPTLIGVAYAASALGIIVFSPFSSQFMETVGRSNLFRLLAFTSIISAILFWFQLQTHNFWNLMALRFIWGFCLAITMPALYDHLRVNFNSSGWLIGLGNSSSKIGHLIGYAAGIWIASAFGIFASFKSVAVIYGILSILFMGIAIFYNRIDSQRKFHCKKQSVAHHD